MDIYHLYGQHFAPHERYPAGQGYDIWNADSISIDKPWLRDKRLRKAVAEYDNATLYNDAVVSSIIKRYKGTPTVFVYFSDHGEQIYDFSPTSERIIIPTKGKNYLRDWLRTEYEIPLFIIYNSEYRRMFAANCQLIANGANRPGSADNIGHTVLGLCGATDNPYYRAERDILSSAYSKPERLITWGINYDTTVKNNVKSN